MKNFKQLWKYFVQDDTINLKKNENEIMNLLFNSNFTPLEMSQSIVIMQNVTHKFNQKKLQSENYHKSELEAIQKFGMKKSDRLKEIINNPVFNIPVHNVEFLKTE